MSNVKHPKCAMRDLAKEAKSRLSANTYQNEHDCPIPKNITPEQKIMYQKLFDMSQLGETCTNPISQLADSSKLNGLSHEERQRYIIQLCADFVAVKKLFNQLNPERAIS